MLSDLKNRGVKGILIINELTWMEEAVKAIYPPERITRMCSTCYKEWNEIRLIQRLKKKWVMRIKDWNHILQQLKVYFGEMVSEYL